MALLSNGCPHYGLFWNAVYLSFEINWINVMEVGFVTVLGTDLQEVFEIFDL